MKKEVPMKTWVAEEAMRTGRSTRTVERDVRDAKKYPGLTFRRANKRRVFVIEPETGGGWMAAAVAKCAAPSDGAEMG